VFEVSDSAGREPEAGRWTVAARDATAWYAASSSVPAPQVRGFAVMTGARVLVRVGIPVAPARLDGSR
jgi:hypothetical protein